MQVSSLFLLCVQDVSCSDKDRQWSVYNPFYAGAPEADKTCIGTTFTHPTNESDLLVCVFVRVMMRTTRLWRKGFGCTIVAITQSIDELAIGVVLNGSLCDAVLICIGKNRLIILGENYLREKS